MQASTVLELPPDKKVVVMLIESLASLIIEEKRGYTALFNNENTLVTLSGETKEIIQCAETDVRVIIERIEGSLLTKTLPLRFLHVPSIRSERVRMLIASIEDSHHLEISFTPRRIPLLEFSSVVGSFYPKKYLRDIIDPPTIPENPCWSVSMPGRSTSVMLPSDSSALEEFFQFGGSQVVLSGMKCMVDFKEMKIRSETGEVASISRSPALVTDSDFPQHRITMNVKGGSEYIHNAIPIIKKYIKEDLVTSSPITIRSAVLPEYRPQLEQQINNCCRQFCIELIGFNTVEGYHTFSIKGAKDYINWVVPQLDSLVQALLLKFRALSEKPALSPVNHPVVINPQPLVPIENYPPNWTHQVSNCVICDVPQMSDEWRDVLRRMQDTLPRVICKKIERVQNKTIWERHKLEKQQMSARNNGEINDKLLFHGTGNTNPHQIAQSEDGIDFRHSTRERKLMWGKGAYFAVKASYSNQYAYKLAEGTRQIILVNVLTGFSHNYGSTHNYDLTKPPPRPVHPGAPVLSSNRSYDTVCGHTGDSDVYVVYDLTKSYPAYIITYSV